MTRRMTIVAVLATVLSAAQLHVQAQREGRFDDLVRADFFAGLKGDADRLKRAMTLCEQTLASNPKHAEAMVWHGSGLLFLSGQAHQAGDHSKGTELWRRGREEMDRALALEPENVGVLIPRGATFLEISKHVPDRSEQKTLLQEGVNAYEKTLKLQQSYFSSLSVHARGELLIGLADGWDRSGDKAKARAYYERILQECPNSGYAERAKKWLER